MPRRIIIEKIFKVFILLIFGCSEGNQLQIEEIIGNYRNIIEAKNFSNLKLLKDGTFFLNQSPNFGDINKAHYGKWIGIENKIKLISSINLEEFLTIEKVENCQLDSLWIRIEENLKDKIGDFNLKIDIDSMVWRNPVEIKLDKGKFYRRLDPKKLKQDKEKYYKYYPIKMFIWNKEFHFVEWYIFSNSEVNISLKRQIPMRFDELELIEYEYKNKSLIPVRSNDVVLKDQLVKDMKN